GPALVLFGWDGVERGMEGETAQLYAVCKGAVVSFGRSLAQELAPEVRVNVVSPGWIRTTWGAVASEAAAKRVAAESLSGRWGTAEEVAAVVRFLTSDAAAYVNGQNVPVNGGFSFRRRVATSG
ncbi:MAG: SDR family oxidoreductase, partial [Thermoguttaceae bacterium]|nr:SDR family oxidoreductase [Thermoguttaceae bacterium]